jgi:hypothetical protein
MINQTISVKISNIFPDESGLNMFTKICESFHNQQIGRVFCITTTRLPFNKKYGYQMYNIFVYLSVWYDTAAAENMQTRILAKKKCNFMYDAPQPWFWLIAENKSRRLSKNELQMLREDREFYHNELEAQMQEQQDVEDSYMSQLWEQNDMIQRLQSICIQNGLDIPFWDAKNPPAFEDTTYDLSSAQTALECSSVLFTDEEVNESTDALAHECAVSVLNEDIWTQDFIPVPYYENDNYYAADEQSRLPMYLGLEEDYGC